MPLLFYLFITTICLYNQAYFFLPSLIIFTLMSAQQALVYPMPLATFVLIVAILFINIALVLLCPLLFFLFIYLVDEANAVVWLFWMWNSWRGGTYIKLLFYFLDDLCGCYLFIFLKATLVQKYILKWFQDFLVYLYIILSHIADYCNPVDNGFSNPLYIVINKYVPASFRILFIFVHNFK